jgi:hypothetical protein
MSKRIDLLADLFSQYRIYPSECYNADSIVRQFQKTHPSDHYSVDIEQFLVHHQYKQVRSSGAHALIATTADEN